MHGRVNGYVGDDDARRRARRAVAQAVVAGGAAAVIAFGLGRPGAGAVVACIAGVILASGLFVPAVFAAIERGARALGAVVAVIMTWLLLAPFFYLVFVPGRLVLAFTGRDPMCREQDPAASTYWVDRPPGQRAGSYTRQY